MEDMQIIQISFLETKTIVSEMKKKIWNEINHRLDNVEEKTNEFEDTAVETTKNDTQRKKTEKTRTSVISGTTSNGQACM